MSVVSDQELKILSHSEIVDAAHRVGFDLCGVVRADEMVADGERFDRWLAAGCHGPLAYMARNRDKRFAPARLVEGAGLVIVCALCYGAADGGVTCDEVSDVADGGAACAERGERAPKIAAYACREDYHRVIRRMLKTLAREIGLVEQGVAWRAFVDSAPLAEKSLAVRAGLGMVGRNSLILNPRYGSRLLFGELVVCAEADRYSEPLAENPCTGCGACVAACPADALPPEGGVDARRCIACRTVEPAAAEWQGERVDDGEAWRAGWLFGCDECQRCCPINRRAEQRDNPNMPTLFNPSSLSATYWQSISDEEFERLYGHTPLSRAGAERLRKVKF